MPTLPADPLRPVSPGRVLLYAAGTGLLFALLSSGLGLLPRPNFGGPPRLPPQPGFEPFGPWRLLLQGGLCAIIVAAEFGRRGLAAGRLQRWGAHVLFWAFWGPSVRVYDGNEPLARWVLVRLAAVFILASISVGLVGGWRWLQARILRTEAAG